MNIDDKIISEPHLTQIKYFLEEKLGLHYTRLRDTELSRKLRTAAKAFGYEKATSFIIWLLNVKQSQSNLEKLASYLTIGETYFLREEEAFQFLRYEYLQKLLVEKSNSEKKLLVWSAGCSSGEEVYSLAGMLHEILPDINDWKIRIVGTDINPSALDKARSGIYTNWSFRKTPYWFKKKYVEKIDEKHFRVCDCLRNIVEFRIHNLAANHNIFDNQNIIFCRNVLIYFSDILIQKVTRAFYNSLTEGGVLILSPVEVSLNIYKEFSRLNYNSRTFFIKNNVAKNLENYLEIDIEEKEKSKPALEESEKSTNDCDKEFDRIRFLFEEGMYLRVENLIYKKNENIKQLPYCYKLLLARVFANTGKLEQAADLCLHLQIEQGFSIDVNLLLSDIYASQSLNKKALYVLHEVIKKKPGHIMSLYKTAVIEKNLGYKHSAISHFRKAFELLESKEINYVVDKETGISVEGLRNTISAYLDRDYNEN